MDLNKAQNKIRNAYITGIVISALLVATTLRSYVIGVPLAKVFMPYVAIVSTSVLTYGIYKRSRACTVTQFIGYLMVFVMALIALRREGINDNLSSFMETIGVIQLIIFLVSLYFVFEGIRGTFVYHKLIKSKTQSCLQ